MKKVLSYFLGMITVSAIIIITLFTSIEIAAFSDLKFYSKEYSKNNVYSIIDIEEKELMDITVHLLDYMKDKKENLNIKAVVGGKEEEFFNEKEKTHMVDVKNLFLMAIALRRFAVMAIILSIILIKGMGLDIKRILSRCVIFGFLGFFIFFLLLYVAISRDFFSVFIKFHEIFFTNELWVLNPETDRLIMMVPEEFFYDVTVRIGIIFFVVNITIFFISLIVLLKERKLKRFL